MASLASTTELTEAGYGYDDSRFENDVDENFHCSICYNVLKEPRMCRNNEHIFCKDCITKHLQVNSETCPECKEHLSVETLRRAPRVVNNFLSDLKINCDYASRGCAEFIRVQALKTHVENCGFAPVLCSNEECGMEINKQERIHHETAVCEYRKVKCHDCGQIQEVLGRLEGRLTEIDKTINKKVDSTKQDLEIVKKEVRDMKGNLSRVKKDVDDVKVMISQILEKLNMLQVQVPTPTVGTLNRPALNLSWPAHFRPPGTAVNRRMNRRQLLPGNPTNSHCIVIPGQDVLVLSDFTQATAAEQKEMLGDRLFPLIHQTHSHLAGKITAMLLGADNAELLHMLGSPDALSAKIKEAVSVLQAHEEREKKHKPYNF